MVEHDLKGIEGNGYTPEEIDAYLKVVVVGTTPPDSIIENYSKDEIKKVFRLIEQIPHHLINYGVEISFNNLEKALEILSDSKE